jgi:hypothetical protein
VNAFPAIPTISQLGNNLVSSAATGNQWLLNGTIIPGATGQSYTPTQIGTYTVAVTENGCTSISPPFPVTSVGLNEIDGINFTSFPNPVSGILNLRSDKPITFDGLIKVFDLRGREVLPAINISSGTAIKREIDVTTLEEGMYFLNIQGRNESARISFQVIR